MTTTRRSLLWVLTGVALTSIVMLADLSRLLGSIESVGRRAYDARVFTGFQVFFWDTSEPGSSVCELRRQVRQVVGGGELCSTNR